MQHFASAPWLALRRELFSVSLDPYSLREIRRGFLPPGSLVEEPERVLHDAATRDIEAVTIRVRASADAERIRVERVAVQALRNALGLGAAPGARRKHDIPGHPGRMPR